MRKWLGQVLRQRCVHQIDVPYHWSGEDASLRLRSRRLFTFIRQILSLNSSFMPILSAVSERCFFFRVNLYIFIILFSFFNSLSSIYFTLGTNGSGENPARRLRLTHLTTSYPCFVVLLSLVSLLRRGFMACWLEFLIWKLLWVYTCDLNRIVMRWSFPACLLPANVLTITL